MLMWVIHNMLLTYGDCAQTPLFFLFVSRSLSVSLSTFSLGALLSLTQVFGLLLSCPLFPHPPLSVCEKKVNLIRCFQLQRK